MKKKINISILMTVYNSQEFVLKSIKSILNQSYKNFKLIIVNDGSNDNTKNILKKFNKRKNIKIFNLKKNIGRTNALNFGLKRCKTKYIAILDADDVSLKNRLKIQFNFLEKNTNIHLVFSSIKWIDRDSKVIKEKKASQKDINNLVVLNSINHSSIMFRSIVLKKIKFYPKEFIYAQDYAFLLKVFKYFKISFLQNCLCHIRQHNLNMTNNLSLKKIIINEQLKLYNWSLNNIIITIDQKILIKFNIIKLKIKQLLTI